MVLYVGIKCGIYEFEVFLDENCVNCVILFLDGLVNVGFLKLSDLEVLG